MLPEPVWIVRRQIQVRAFFSDQVGDQPARLRPSGQADMVVPEAGDHAGAADLPDQRQAVRRGRPVAQPFVDAVEFERRKRRRDLPLEQRQGRIGRAGLQAAELAE